MSSWGRDLTVDIAGVKFKNPVLTASGTFGSGREYSHFIDLNRLGGIIVKGVSHEPWDGNKPPRIAETPSGMLNAIGLQNPGAKAFIEKDMPFLRTYDTKVVVNLCGHTLEEYVAVAKDFKGVHGVSMFELNISCPNIDKGGMAFGTDPVLVKEVVSAIKACTRVPLVVKLSPNVTNIVAVAQAAEAAGADALSLINTLIGMKVDIHSRKPVLANTIGGLSGPAIKPVAVRMVYQVAKNVSIPIIGMGGIMTGEDAIEFIMAGATAIAVGTANFTNPAATINVLEGIEAFMRAQGIQNLNEIRGIL
ncbi:MAG: dihydroorotate dehydrogenase [Defluviitaleaceae bacterium]|nr:dihydroorotate dehydrogenase [Defluviitaleaceae bacterium]